MLERAQKASDASAPRVDQAMFMQLLGMAEPASKTYAEKMKH